ncbi:hypothetical protein [Denitromonas sp.]|uniref:hypothetical protein n=1 Tax=Denitromonas sp. TaxID=2734609 RepID=UPI003A89BB98
MPDICFQTDSDGFICEPELTDAGIESVHVQCDSIVLRLDIPKGDGARFAITCQGIVASRIDHLTTQNISLDFFVSSAVKPGSATISKGLLDSLFGHGQVVSVTRESAESMLQQGSAVLFGNEPSCGCEVAVLCRAVLVSSVQR